MRNHAGRWKAPDLQNLVKSTMLRQAATGYGHLLRFDQEAILRARQPGTIFVAGDDELVQAFRDSLREFRATLYS